ncbi:hypothetical protein ACN2WE_00890 [Streptomyces sp. cg28]|uniref:hypothetical protein n=1 Tax=Streptomyces sp. cg28 TaxID=3403457 RepID=UPI003B21FE57
MSIAALWVEDVPLLRPGGRAVVRLVPLTPAHWTRVETGQHITMHEDRTVAGTAVVLKVRLPTSATPTQ